MSLFSINGIPLNEADCSTASPALQAALVNLPETEQQEVRLFLQQWFDKKQAAISAQTSGSTGTPKTIRLKKTQMVASAQATAAFFDFQEGQTALLPLSVRYIAGKMMLVRAILSGLHVTLVNPANDPLKMLPAQQNFDFAVLVPLQFASVIEQNQLKRFGKVLLGGAALPAHLKPLLVPVKTPVYQGFGMTETVSHMALRLLNGPQAAQVYTALPGIELGADERGCLRICGPATDFQWVQSNDLVEFTDERSFRWRGRFDNILNSGGIKVALEEIEAEIARLISEEDCLSWLVDRDFAIGRMPHPRYGESAAIWVTGPMPSEHDRVLSLRCFKEQLPIAWSPRAILSVEELPRLVSGKLDRMALVTTYGLAL